MSRKSRKLPVLPVAIEPAPAVAAPETPAPAVAAPETPAPAVDAPAVDVAPEVAATLAALDESTLGCTPVVRRGSVISATYKKLHTLDGLAEDIHDAVTDEQTGKLDQRRFDRLCAANGIAVGRWGHLNPGMQVMNLSNVLRNRLAKGQEVVRYLPL